MRLLENLLCFRAYSAMRLLSGGAIAVLDKGDCDDEDPDTFPGAPELCDGKNSDCDALSNDKEKTSCSGEEAGHVEPPSSSEPDGNEPDESMGGSGSKPDDDKSPDDDDDDEPDESGFDSEKDPQDMIDDGHEDDRGCTYSPLPSGPGGMAHGLGGLLLLSVILARRTRRRTEVRKGMAVLAGLLALALPSQARAELPPDCVALGKALVEHSCFHSEFGPFEYRIPTQGAEANEDTPNVDPVHTQYRLILAPGENTVTYTPARAGSFSMFTGWDVPLSVAWPEGEIPELFRMEETGCDALPLSRVFELEAHEIYTLTFEVSEPGEVVLVIEYIDDFSVKNGLDQDGDGYGDPDNTVTTSCVPPAGYAPNTSDCDDTNPLIHPAAAELCGDAIDQNCNGLPDDTGFSCRLGTGACLVEGTMVCGDDGQAACAATLVEGTPEECNGRDDDCDGEIDEEDGLCPDAQAPRCVRFQLAASCGCQFDSDCAVSGDGYVCHAGTGTCERDAQEPDEGIGGLSNEGSGGRVEPNDPAGGRLNDEDDEDDMGEEEPAAPSADESGCGCRTHRRAPWGGDSVAALLLGAGWFLRRRGRSVAHPRRHA